MKTLATLALAALVILAGPASAQDVGDAGIFADSEGTLTTAPALPGAATTIYVLAFGVEFEGYEFSVTGIPAGVFVVRNALQGPAPLNVVDSNNYNYVVGAGGCVANPGVASMVEIDILPLSPLPNDTAIVLSGATPSSFGGAPGYADCSGAATLFPFGIATSGGADGEGNAYPDGALILSPTGTGPVDNEADSFGGLKARF